MSDSFYTFRNYQPVDFDKYVRLNIEVEKLEPSGRCVSPQVLGENLGRPNYSPEQDLLIVETAGELVGYVNVTPELNARRVMLDCLVHPEHRRRGLAKKLLGSATHRAKELRAKVPVGGIDLHKIKASFPDRPGCFTEATDDGFHLSGGQLPAGYFGIQS